MMKLLFDVGESSARSESVPRCFYEFVTILNNTRFDFSLYKGNSSLVKDIIGNCPAYTILTFPYDKLTDIVNFVWEGGGGGSSDNERCQIFFSADNLGLVGQFRPPEKSPNVMPGKTLFAGNAASGDIISCSNKIVIDSLYLTNRDAADSTLTISHIRGGVSSTIVSNLKIPANSTYALGYFSLNSGDKLNVSSVTGNITINVYGEGV